MDVAMGEDASRGYRPTADQLAVMDRAAFLRGRIIQAFAQIEFLVTDLIIRCEMMPEYALARPTFPYKTETRIAQIRSILGKPGPLAAYGGELIPLLEGWLEHADHRHLMAHGSIEITFDPIGHHMIRFRLLRAGRGNYEEGIVDCTLVQIHQTELTLTGLSQATVTLIRRIHESVDLPIRESNLVEEDVPNAKKRPPGEGRASVKADRS